MHTKQTIHDIEANATEQLNEVEAVVSHLHNEGTTQYSYVVKHPELEQWAVRYNMSGKYWEEVEQYITTLSTPLLEIEDDWHNEQEF